MQLQSQVKFRLSHEMKSGLVYNLEDSMLPQELADDSFRYKRLVYVNNIILIELNTYNPNCKKLGTLWKL